jgi:hypothetical protein
MPHWHEPILACLFISDAESCAGQCDNKNISGHFDSDLCRLSKPRSLIAEVLKLKAHSTSIRSSTYGERATHSDPAHVGS